MSVNRARATSALGPSQTRFKVCAFWLWVGASVAGCSGFMGPPDRSTVGKGQYYSTANPDYDEFFLRLFRLQVDLGKAPEGLAKARAGLTIRLGLGEKAETDALGTALADKARELRSRGVNVQVDRGREPTARPALNVNGNRTGADAELIGTLEEAIRVSAEIREKLGGWRKELDELPPRGIALDSNVETAFLTSGPGTRSEIRANLADAQKVMGLMGPLLKELEQGSNELIASIASAVGEVSHAPPPPPPPPESETNGKAADERPTPRPGARRGTRPAAKPSEPAAPATPPAAPPPPKPGPAKPDFEP